MRRFLVLALSALAIFAAGSAWLVLYPGVPRDLDGAPDLDHVARHVGIPVGEDTLDGWTLAGSRRAVVILFHGYGRDHTRAWRYASFLHRAGYAILALDFRSSSARDRKPTTLGAYEMQDAEAALAWVEHEPGLRGSRIGLLGESLGGSVALVLAARHPEIAAVVADCPFATGRRALEDGAERKLHLPQWPTASLARWLGRMATGADPGALDVIAAAESLRARPPFLVSAERDDRFSPGQAEAIWRAAGSRGTLWLAAGGHNEAWQHERAEYERRVLQFFGRALAPPAASRPAPARGVKPAARPRPGAPRAAGRGGGA
jgi:pimeloyl-ACP methyl ester carboxylesterase